MQAAILSVRELREKDRQQLKAYKAFIHREKIKATTDFEQEAYTAELDRVNTILNEAETVEEKLEREEKAFQALKEEMDCIIQSAQIRGVTLTGQDKQAGTSGKLCVTAAVCPNIEER